MDCRDINRYSLSLTSSQLNIRPNPDNDKGRKAEFGGCYKQDKKKGLKVFRMKSHCAAGSVQTRCSVCREQGQELWSQLPVTSLSPSGRELQCREICKPGAECRSQSSQLPRGEAAGPCGMVYIQPTEWMQAAWREDRRCSFRAGRTPGPGRVCTISRPCPCALHVLLPGPRAIHTCVVGMSQVWCRARVLACGQQREARRGKRRAGSLQ